MNRLYYSIKLSSIILAAIFLSSLFTACDHGLEPPAQSQKSYITGIITIKGGKSSWPKADSLKDFRVASFLSYPPKDIVTEVLSGNAFFTPNALPFNFDTESYSIEIPAPPRTINYIAVAWQYGGLMEWRAVGVYAPGGDRTKPGSVLVEPGKTYKVDIEVDFNNLPPQPF